MARMNTKNAVAKNNASSPVKTRKSGKRVTTAEGGTGWKRTAKGELFLAAVTSLNEDTFYESAEARQERVAKLVAKVAKDGEWVLGLVGWLRRDAGLRAVPVMVAAEAVHYRLSKSMNGLNREIVRASIGRLDETSEFIAYWLERFGRKIPSAVKRGISDALNNLLNEGSYLKWSGRASRGSVSLGDVINLVHAKPKDSHQSALYQAVLDRQYGAKEDLTALPVMKARQDFLSMPVDKQIKVLSGTDSVIKSARLTHEVVAGSIGKIPAEVWESLIPHMGYTALRMNLRRISESGVSLDVIDEINKVLRDKEKVARAKVMPIDFLRAYRNAPLDFHAALQRGANGVLDNIPALKGRTLVLLDRSGSMGDYLSSKSQITRQDAANVFAAALALRCDDVDVVAFDTNSQKVHITSKDLLKVVENDMPNSRGGTYTARAFREHYNNHDRVIVLTDEQTSMSSYWTGGESLDEALDAGLKKGATVFTWNLAGYTAAHNQSKDRRWTFGGLTDKGFQMIPLLEKGVSQSWPWEN